MAIDGNPLTLRWTPAAVVSLLYLAIASSVVAFWLNYWLLKRVSATTVLSMALVQPLIAAVLGALFLAERFGAGAAIGGACILLSAAMILRGVTPGGIIARRIPWRSQCTLPPHPSGRGWPQSPHSRYRVSHGYPPSLAGPRRARAAADDVSRHAADAAGRLADARAPIDRLLLYTLSTPDWKEAKRQTDLYLVSMQTGIASTRQLTFTKEKNETDAAWAPDGSHSSFFESRSAGERRLRGISSTSCGPTAGKRAGSPTRKEGVSEYRVSRDGEWLAFRTGKSGEEQFIGCRSRPSIAPAAEQITKHHDRRQQPGNGRQTAGASTSSRRIGSMRTRRHGATRNSPSISATPKRRSPACGRWTWSHWRPRA